MLRQKGSIIKNQLTMQKKSFYQKTHNMRLL